VWLWFALRVWCVRESWEREDWRVWRCWVRKEESVESESEMRRREAVSLPILKCEVHCEMSWRVFSGYIVVSCNGTYGSGIFVEKHFG
jgi:hypothetical protein